MISILMLVLLLQKSAGGLLLHDWLHIQKESVSYNSETSVTETPATCTCIDDFCLPFTETATHITEPLPLIHNSFVEARVSFVTVSPLSLPSLRGPPALIA